MSLISLTGCDSCSLKKEWKYLANPKMSFTAPTEATDKRFLVLGESPGEKEDLLGQQFVGKSGQYVRDFIPAEWKKKLYWQNVVRCRPPKNRTPSTQEMACCSTYLEKDLLAIKPHGILGLGPQALSYFWPGTSLAWMRGIPFPVKLDDGTATWFMATFHPTYTMQASRKNYEDNTLVNTVEPVFKGDIRRFFERASEFATPPKIWSPPPPSSFIYPKSFDDARALFARLKPTYTFDIETFKKQPYARDARILSSAYSDGELTFAFPVDWPGGVCPWGMQAFNEFNKSGRRWVGQGACFELRWLWHFGGYSEQTFDDTEIKARLVHQRAGINSLAELSRIYLGFNVKEVSSLDVNRLLEYPLEKVLQYNAYDAWSEANIDEILDARLTKVDRENYDRILMAIRSTVMMELKGLPVDLKASDVLNKSLQHKMLAIEERAREIPEVKEFERKEGQTFRLSARQNSVGPVLVNYCGIQLPKTAGGTQYSTDEKDLQAYIGKVPLVDIILDYAEVQKLKSTYVEPILTGKVLGVDGLLHAAYTTVHTATFRLSSYDPNIQNFPKRKHKEVRKQVMAPPGYLMVAFDYGQLEARVLAMASRCPGLSKALISKEDIHWKWLDRIIDKYPPYMDRLARVSGEKLEKKIREAGRTIIKTDFVFASFYGSLPPSISERTEIPLAIAREVLGEFWAEYYGVKQWIDGQFALYQENGFVASLTGRVRSQVLPGNEVINTPVQGTAAEIVLEAQNALFIRALLSDIMFLPRINIHDDLIFFFRDDESVEHYIRETGKEIVEVRFPFVNVPLTTECRAGYNWAELEKVTTFEGAYLVN